MFRKLILLLVLWPWLPFGPLPSKPCPTAEGKSFVVYHCKKENK